MTTRLAAVLARVRGIEATLSALKPTAAAGPSSFAGELARAVGAADNPPFDEFVRAAATRYGVDPALVHAVVRAESGYNPDARSPAGAQGLMQLMPATAQALGVTDAYDVVQNIFAGTRYLRSLLDRYGDVGLSLAAYNAGPGAVNKFAGMPPYPETRAYVGRVLQYWLGE